MKNIIIILGLVIASCYATKVKSQRSAALGAAPYEKNCKYGLIREDRKIIIKPQYDYVDFFYESIFKTKYIKGSRNYYGLISKQGKIILPCKYDTVYFVDRMIENEDLPAGVSVVLVAKYNNDEMYFTLEGKQFKLKGKLSLMGIPDGGTGNRKVFFSAFSKNGKWGISYDYEVSKVIVKPVYDTIEEVHSDTADFFIVRQDKTWGLMNTSGELIAPLIYDNIEKNHFTLINNFVVVSKGNLKGILNEKGNEIVPMLYNTIEIANGYSNWFFIVTKNGLASILNTDNKILIPFKNYTIQNYQFLSGFILLDNNSNKRGFYSYGGYTLPCQYTAISRLINNRFLLLTKEGRCNFYFDMSTNKELSGTKN